MLDTHPLSIDGEASLFVIFEIDIIAISLVRV